MSELSAVPARESEELVHDIAKASWLHHPHETMSVHLLRKQMSFVTDNDHDSVRLNIIGELSDVIALYGRTLDGAGNLFALPSISERMNSLLLL